MRILALTGSIGMGKSTAAGLISRMGIPVHDSDAAVHRLLGPGGAAVPAVAAIWPDVVHAGAVDRRALGWRVFGRPEELRRLEAILHPMVWDSTIAFLRRAAARRRRLVVLDIPLLYETGRESRVDAVVVVTAPRFMEVQRVLARPGMTPERLQAVLAQQMPDWQKRRRAEHVVSSGIGRAHAFRRLRAIVAAEACRRGRHWPPDGYRPRGRTTPFLRR